MWQEPKTNWKSSDSINYTDYNRIIGNIEELLSIASELYIDIEQKDLVDEKTSYSQYPYADEFSAIESALSYLKTSTFPFFTTGTRVWVDYDLTPTYNDLNRIESACLDVYNGLNSQKENKKKLSITLGKDKFLKI